MCEWIDFNNMFQYEKIMYDVLLPSGEKISECWANNGYLNANDGRIFDTKFGAKVTPSEEWR